MSTTAENMVPSTVTPNSGVAFYSLIFIVTGLVIIHYWQRNTRYFKMGNKLPGPTPIPFFGNALQVWGSPEELMIKALAYGEVFGEVIRGWLGPLLFVFLTNPADIEIILNSNVHLDKSNDYDFFKPWLGNGLLISSGDKWRSHRKMIAPTFHMNVLKSFVDVFNNNSQKLVKKLRKEVGKTFDCHDYLSEITVDILIETAMGIKKTTENKAGYEYAMAVIKMCDILHRRHIRFWLRPEFIFRFTSMAKRQKQLLGLIHGLTRSVIGRKKAEFEEKRMTGDTSSYFEEIDAAVEKIDRVTEKQIMERKKFSDIMNNNKNVVKNGPLRDDLDEIDENDVGEKKRLAFLDLLIETSANGTNGKLSDEEINDQVNTIMFEGHDTTAAGSSFVLSILGVHQDIQDKVYEELNQIFGKSDRPVTYHDTLEMKYLERVIMETLRLYPPVPVIARKVNEDVKLASGDHVIPAGATVVIATFKLHRRPDIYPDALVFDPDNFLPERTQNRHYYSFIPFSAGPRSCVGRKYAMLKLKILLATILRNYKIKSNLTEKDFRLQADIILKRVDGFKIEIEERT